MKWWWIALFPVIAHGFCYMCPPPRPPPPCCHAPNITVNMSQIGFLDIDCANTTCGWVQTPISTQTCGCTWYGQQFISWSDPRMFSCLKVAQNPRELRFRGWIRWWSGNCLGHTEIEYDVQIVPTREDIFIHFPPCEYYVDEINTRIEIGADGAQVLVDGQTNLTFTVTLTNSTLQAHAEISECFIDVLENPDEPDDGNILRIIPSSEFPTNDFTITYADPNGEQARFTTFIDNVTYSPWQRLRCNWNFFSGTTVESYSHNHSFALLDLDENVHVWVH